MGRPPLSLRDIPCLRWGKLPCGAGGEGEEIRHLACGARGGAGRDSAARLWGEGEREGIRQGPPHGGAESFGGLLADGSCCC